MSVPAWLPVSISSSGTILALIAFGYQVHRARFNQSVDLLFKLEADFFGPAKRARRVKAAAGLLKGEPLEAEPILDFFETMALLLRRGALDLELVKHTFFYWIDGYYTASTVVIQQRQATNPLIWKDLGVFVEKLRSLQARQTSTPYRLPSSTETAAFLNEELTEA